MYRTGRGASSSGRGTFPTHRGRYFSNTSEYRVMNAANTAQPFVPEAERLQALREKYERDEKEKADSLEREARRSYQEEEELKNNLKNYDMSDYEGGKIKKKKHTQRRRRQKKQRRSHRHRRSTKKYHRK